MPQNIQFIIYKNKIISSLIKIKNFKCVLIYLHKVETLEFNQNQEWIICEGGLKGNLTKLITLKTSLK